MCVNLLWKTSVHIAQLFLVYAIAWPSEASAEDGMASRKDLEHALENAVLCDTDALNIFNGALFDGGPDDPEQKLKSLGVVVTSESDHGGQMRYQLPRGVTVFGYEATEALYSSPARRFFSSSCAQG